MTQNFNSQHPKYNSIHVLENVKVSEIRDALNNLRYKVALMNYETYIGLDLKIAYKIQVVNCFYGEEHLIILTVPEEGEAELTDYGKAVAIYQHYVKVYTSLVKAETRDLQDMDIYSIKVNYHHTCPKCCATCRWCKKRPMKKDFVFGVTGKLECHNPKNFAEFDYDLDRRSGHDVPGIWNHPKHYDDHVRTRIDMHPNVTAFGVCDNYETQKKKFIPGPGDSITDLIDHRVVDAVSCAVSASMNTNVESMVRRVIGEEISAQILPEVDHAIATHLNNNPPIIEGNRNINDYNGDGIISEDEVILYDGGGA